MKKTKGQGSPSLRNILRSTTAARYLSRGLCVAAVAGLTSPAFAQTTAPAQDAGATEASDGDIVVTAFRRDQRLIDIGASISALSSENIAEARVEQVKDIARSIPNIDVRESIPGVSPVLTIRGVGLDDFSTTNSPATGVSIDDVPLSSIALMNADFFDIERIEVVKGPQGTLYGRNTVAGAMNVISARPKDRFDAAASIGYGNYQTLDAEAMINIPLGEGLAARFSGKTIQQERGFWTSSRLIGGAIGERDVGERHVWMGRAQLGYDSGDGLDLNLKYEYQQARSEMGQYEFFGAFVPGQPFVLCAPVLAGKVDNSQCADAYGFTNTSNDPYDIDQSADLPYDLNQHSLSFAANYDLGDVKLTAITGYIDFKRAYRIDVDATPRDELDFIQRDNVKQFTQELRLAHDSDLVDVIVGGFYSWDRARGLNDNILTEFPLVLFGFPSQTGYTTFDQKTKSAAGFVNGTWHLGDNLDLITGVRYTWEKRHYVGGTDFPLCPIATNPCAPFGIFSSYTDTTISDKNWSWKFGLDYRVAPDTLLYASASKGTKSGGFVSRISTIPAQLLPFNPESLIAYEIGVRSQPLSNFTINAATFYYDFKNVQALILDGSLAVPAQRLGNIPGKSEIYGVEADVSFRPFTGFTLQSGIGLLHTKLAPFTNGSGTFTDNRFSNAPGFMWNGLARYETPIGNGDFNLVLQGNFTHQSTAYKDASNDIYSVQHPYWLFDARVALSWKDGKWEAALWGKNLSNEVYTVSSDTLTGLGIIGRTVNPPRTYGLSLSWKY